MRRQTKTKAILAKEKIIPMAIFCNCECGYVSGLAISQNQEAQIQSLAHMQNVDGGYTVQILQFE